MSKQRPNWTPEQIRNKTAEQWQAGLYVIGVLAGLIAWVNFSKNAPQPGIAFAVIAMAAFGLGSLIKTVWVKAAQANVYVKDKAREALRMKFYGAGVIAGVIAWLVLSKGGKDAGGIFALICCASLLIGGMLPVRWIKVGEGAKYK